MHAVLCCAVLPELLHAMLRFAAYLAAYHTFAFYAILNQEQV